MNKNNEQTLVKFKILLAASISLCGMLAFVAYGADMVGMSESQKIATSISGLAGILVFVGTKFYTLFNQKPMKEDNLITITNFGEQVKKLNAGEITIEQFKTGMNVEGPSHTLDKLGMN